MFLNRTTYGMINACSSTHNCSCKQNSYIPICTKEDHTTYFSPCHAGCRTETKLDGDVVRLFLVKTSLGDSKRTDAKPYISKYGRLTVSHLVILFHRVQAITKYHQSHSSPTPPKMPPLLFYSV